MIGDIISLGLRVQVAAALGAAWMKQLPRQLPCRPTKDRQSHALSLWGNDRQRRIITSL